MSVWKSGRPDDEGRCVRAAEVDGDSIVLDGLFDVLILKFLTLPETGRSFLKFTSC